METVKNHIESITNGNSRGLAYWIAIGVITLVLNWATGVVKIVMESKQQPNVVFNDKEILTKQEKQINLLTEIVYQLRNNNKDINSGHNQILDTQNRILKEAEKMDSWRTKRP